VLGLSGGDDVRIAGVRVGRVQKIELDSHNRAKVTFIVQSDQHLYTNTKALVRYQNLIGQRYLALEAGEGGAAPLPAGGSIPLSHTEPSFDISLLLGGFQPLFQMLQPQQVNQLSDALIQALQGDGVSLTAFITQAAQVADEFHNRDAILGDIITNLSGVITGLGNRGEQLNTLILQTKALVSGLYAQGQSLLHSTEAVAGATSALSTMVGRIEPSLRSAQNSASAALSLLINDGSRLDRTAVELPAILTGVARWTGQGAYANAYSCTLDVSLWGVLPPYGLLPQLGGNSHSAVCR
jgi:phospholipid/cholesterol/gamma-HCH transport system substrate-binding protein